LNQSIIDNMQQIKNNVNSNANSNNNNKLKLVNENKNFDKSQFQNSDTKDNKISSKPYEKNSQVESLLKKISDQNELIEKLLKQQSASNIININKPKQVTQEE